MNNEIAKPNQLAAMLAERRATITDENADLNTVARLFADLGVQVLDDVTNWKKDEKPLISGVVSRALAYVKIEKQYGKADKESAEFCVDIVDNTGETFRVFTNSDLARRIWQAIPGMQGQNYKEFENILTLATSTTEERSHFISTINDRAMALNGTGIVVCFIGKATAEEVARGNAIGAWNKFQVATFPAEVVTNPLMLEAIEATLVPGKNFLSTDTAALPEFMDEDI